MVNYISIYKREFALFCENLLYLSMISGLILVFAYHPSNAYESVQKISYIVPFGRFFRSLHYFSSELFLISLFLHIVFELFSKIKTGKVSWIFSILATISILGLMFSGFVLKGDLSGKSAALVSFSLLKDTPFLDRLVPLFKDQSVFYWKFFVWHSFYLPIFLFFALYKHIRRLKLNSVYFLTAFGLSVAASFVFKMPRDINLYEKISHIKGPWFFWGAENMLQVGLTPAFVNIMLLAPFLLLYLFYFQKYRKFASLLLFIWIAVYVYFTI